jgi:hypothetical protein
MSDDVILSSGISDWPNILEDFRRDEAMDYRVKAGTKVEIISTDQSDSNSGSEVLEDESGNATAQPPTSKQNWAWRSDIGHYDWMDSYTSSFDQDNWNDTFFD